MSLRKEHIIGAVNELKAAQYFLDKGCQVYLPVVQQGKVDLVVEYPDGLLHRVQVKTAVFNRGDKFRYEYLQCRVRGTNKFKVDAADKTYDLFVVVHDTGMWVIPAHEIKTSNLCLGSTNPDYKDRKWERFRVI